MANDLDARSAQLQAALNEARERVHTLTRSAEDADQAAHKSLTTADFSAASEHQARAEAVRVELATAQAAADALERASQQVAQQAQHAQYATQAEAVANTLEATRSQMDEAITAALTALRTAVGEIVRAQAAEDNYRLLYGQLHQLQVAMDHPAPLAMPIQHLPVTSALGESPALATLNNLARNGSI